MKLRTAHYNSYNLFDEVRTRISLRMSKLILDGLHLLSSLLLLGVKSIGAGEASCILYILPPFFE